MVFTCQSFYNPGMDTTIFFSIIFILLCTVEFMEYHPAITIIISNDHGCLEEEESTVDE